MGPVAAGHAPVAGGGRSNFLGVERAGEHTDGMSPFNFVTLTASWPGLGHWISADPLFGSVG